MTWQKVSVTLFNLFFLCAQDFFFSDIECLRMQWIRLQLGMSENVSSLRCFLNLISGISPLKCEISLYFHSAQHPINTCVTLDKEASKYFFLRIHLVCFNFFLNIGYNIRKQPCSNFIVQYPLFDLKGSIKLIILYPYYDKTRNILFPY